MFLRSVRHARLLRSGVICEDEDSVCNEKGILVRMAHLRVRERCGLYSGASDSQYV